MSWWKWFRMQGTGEIAREMSGGLVASDDTEPGRSERCLEAIADRGRARRPRPRFPAPLTQRGLAYAESGALERVIILALHEE